MKARKSLKRNLTEDEWHELIERVVPVLHENESELGNMFLITEILFGRDHGHGSDGKEFLGTWLKTGLVTWLYHSNCDRKRPLDRILNLNFPGRDGSGIAQLVAIDNEMRRKGEHGVVDALIRARVSGRAEDEAIRDVANELSTTEGRVKRIYQKHRPRIKRTIIKMLGGEATSGKRLKKLRPLGKDSDASGLKRE